MTLHGERQYRRWPNTRLCAEMGEAQFANVAANVELFGGRHIEQYPTKPRNLASMGII